MFITEVTVKKEQQKYIEKKLLNVKVFVALNILIALAAIAYLIYICVNKVEGYTPYLFSSLAIVGAIIYCVVLWFEYRIASVVNYEINKDGEGVLRANFNVNLKQKRNGNTIVNWVAFGIVLVCEVAIAIVQIVRFDVTTFANLIVCGVLLIELLYQALTESNNDKLYHECILGKDKQN